MHRRSFLVALGLLPLAGSEILAASTNPLKRQPLLIGLSNAGGHLVDAMARAGYIRKPISIEMSPVAAAFERHSAALLNEASTERTPHAKIFSKLIKQRNAHFVFVAGLGGKRSTYLAALAYRQMKKEGLSFEMILTTPFSFEGTKRVARARAFQEAFTNDPAITYLHLEQSLRSGSRTIKQTFEEDLPKMLSEVCEGKGVFLSKST